MTLRGTEASHPLAEGLDTRDPETIAAALVSSQQDAAAALDGSIADLSKAATLVAEILAGPGRLIYAGAGSAGLMALADALELPGTFGVPREKIVILLAGGADSLVNLAGGYEDDTELARRDAEAISLRPDDCVIVVSASGSTPYSLAISEQAKRKGARVIAIANNSQAPLFDDADVGVLLETPPELVSGSTRLGAGTAQKVALNAISTLAAIHIGHVHDGYMVNVHADNDKLRDRAQRIVTNIAGVDTGVARRLLIESGSVKSAVLLAAGAESPDQAKELLQRSNQNLRNALALIGKPG